MNKTFQSFSEMTDDIRSLKNEDVHLLIQTVQKDKWSIREIIAHLYGWDRFNLQEMVPLMDDRATLPAFPDHDTHNKKVISELKGKSVYEIIDLFIETRQRLVDELQKMEPKATFKIGTGKREFSNESFTKIFIKHDSHHLQQIRNEL
ncbi:DinB family protein [Alkalihalobacillus trypoxylicola]|uniref:DinB-like domain-containing protein n=1 Tax=Alkalihalobacillus trypoxylicola TaxID=519424 RepID=A0A161PB16_9BACI|nr:DinB family protein [Alkalihalobacillus trypoxylicola]KYG29392.1 hypothetical protein AZF04_07660 [Alkalihalobacillus trypoxylicola]